MFRKIVSSLWHRLYLANKTTSQSGLEQWTLHGILKCLPWCTRWSRQVVSFGLLKNHAESCATRLGCAWWAGGVAMILCWGSIRLLGIINGKIWNLPETPRTWFTRLRSMRPSMLGVFLFNELLSSWSGWWGKHVFSLDLKHQSKHHWFPCTNIL